MLTKAVLKLGPPLFIFKNDIVLRLTPLLLPAPIHRNNSFYLYQSLPQILKNA